MAEKPPGVPGALVFAMSRDKDDANLIGLHFWAGPIETQIDIPRAVALEVAATIMKNLANDN